METSVSPNHPASYSLRIQPLSVSSGVMRGDCIRTLFSVLDALTTRIEYFLRGGVGYNCNFGQSLGNNRFNVHNLVPWMAAGSGDKTVQCYSVLYALTLRFILCFRWWVFELPALIICKPQPKKKIIYWKEYPHWTYKEFNDNRFK